jgi:hypothetical protein
VNAAEDARSALKVARVALATAEAAARAVGVFDEPRVVTAERINLVGPDGGLRMVITANTHEIYARGEVIEHPGGRGGPGLIFITPEGTECGGISWDVDGGSFTIDSYEQDQAISIIHRDDDGVRSSVIEFIDRPSWSLLDMITGGHAGQEPHDGPVTRMRLARDEDGKVGLVINDRVGNTRLWLGVDKYGKPSVDLFGPNGGPSGSLG